MNEEDKAKWVREILEKSKKKENTSFEKPKIDQDKIEKLARDITEREGKKK